MKRFQLLILLAVIVLSSSGCGTPTTDITNASPDAKINPAIGPAQREHMANRGPK